MKIGKSADLTLGTWLGMGLLLVFSASIFPFVGWLIAGWTGAFYGVLTVLIISTWEFMSERIKNVAFAFVCTFFGIFFMGVFCLGMSFALFGKHICWILPALVALYVAFKFARERLRGNLQAYSRKTDEFYEDRNVA